MTRTIGTFEEKSHLSELLEHVEARETYVITRRGHPFASLNPAEPVAVRLTVDEAIAGARALRAQVRAETSEIRDWIAEGRA